MRRSALGVVFIGYGLLGIALIVVGAVVGLDVAGRVERLATSADSTLAAAARTTRAASVAFENADASLRDAEASIRNAATLAGSASTTLSSLATAMEISIFGAQPLILLADDFSASADQARELGASLEVVGASLSETRTDIVTIGVEMDRLADDLDALRESSATEGTSPPVRLFIILLLTWLAVPTVGAIIGGLFLLRPVGPAPEDALASVGALEDPPQADQRADVEDRTDRRKRP